MACKRSAVRARLAPSLRDVRRSAAGSLNETRASPSGRLPAGDVRRSRLVNRQITLAARPVGMPQESDFALVESEIPRPSAGEVLVRSLWLSLDPYMRGRMSEARSYAKPTQIGEPMTGQVVGEVVESGDPRFARGEIVVGQLGWQEHAVARGGTLRKVDPSLAPIQTALHVL